MASKRATPAAFFLSTLGLSLLLGRILPAEQRDYQVGRDPSSVTIADFDGDGLVDLAVANRGSNTVSVLLQSSNGDETFNPARDFRVGQGPSSVTSGDFNLDGYTDLVVANRDSNNVAVLWSLGPDPALFQEARFYPAGPRPSFVAVGDFNGDGYPDLAVANAPSSTVFGTVSILLNQGDGTFGQPTFYTVEFLPLSIAVADFNGDSILDLAVANAGSDSISILLGVGDGTFLLPPIRLVVPPVPPVMRSEPYSLAAGPFNTTVDNPPDLAVANAGTNDVAIFINNGRGFAQMPTRRYPAGRRPVSLVAMDFDFFQEMDGNLDLVTANNLSNNASILYGDGRGMFSTLDPEVPVRFLGSFCAPTAVAGGTFPSGYSFLAVTAPRRPGCTVGTMSARSSFGAFDNDSDDGVVSVYRCYPACME